MSRIGRKPIVLPAAVKVELKDDSVHLKGPKGALSLKLMRGITAAVQDGRLSVARADDTKKNRAAHGLMRSLLANMVTGLTQGYRKELEVVGVGFKAQMKGTALQLQLGFSHPVDIVPPAEIKLSVPNPTRIVVEGIDKHLVGQITADIRAVYPPEPYKGKGIRYVGEYVRKKLGKAMAK